MVMKARPAKETMVLLRILEQQLFGYFLGCGGTSSKVELTLFRKVIGQPTSRQHGRSEHGE